MIVTFIRMSRYIWILTHGEIKTNLNMAIVIKAKNYVCNYKNTKVLFNQKLLLNRLNKLCRTLCEITKNCTLTLTDFCICYPRTSIRVLSVMLLLKTIVTWFCISYHRPTFIILLHLSNFNEWVIIKFSKSFHVQEAILLLLAINMKIYQVFWCHLCCRKDATEIIS